MNINQLARNQQMLYRFISRSENSQYSSQMSSLLSGASGKANDATSDLLQSMGISGLKGRTAREMAQYQMRVQNEQKTSAAQKTAAETGANSSVGRFTARQQYTPISDEATEAMQKLALEDAKGSVTGKASSKTERAKLIGEHLKSVDPSKRAAAFNTMNKVWESETERLGKFIKEKDPKWESWGDKFDEKILDDYKAGVNVWV